MKIDPLPYLKGAQADASAPHDNVWLSASAGTGKTSVLASRVLRLLLRGERPDAILCLTFTRAGAAEMAERVHSRLAHWARLKSTELEHELFALGEARDADAMARARTLFASVLDARGGLRVLTIHAFCQTLLGSFPLEAGLAPGFRAVEGREAAALAARVLADVATRAENENDSVTIAALRALSRRLGEDGARRFLLRAARKLDWLEALPSGLAPLVRTALDVPLDYDVAHLAAACSDGAFDRAPLHDLMAMHAEWGTPTGAAAIEAVSSWLLGHPHDRARELGTLAAVWRTQKNTLRAPGPKHPDYTRLIGRLDDWCGALQAGAARAALAEDIAHALHAARTYARAYANAKRAAGAVDFDDLISHAVTLLTTPGMGEWIAYKLDTVTDHILVDEAQDTNQSQWDIVRALIAEFWAEHPDTAKRRTLFSVGDYKQAIFGFQGTDPQHYADAGDDFEARAQTAERVLLRLSLDQSFRSTPPVLDVVDALLEELGAEALGTEIVGQHVSARPGPGSVTLLAPLRAPQADDELGEEGEEGWVPTATRHLATAIAQQVRAWLDEGHRLASHGRALRPGDVMILVRRRSDLAALLVARLQQEGVAVAGVDRLRLAAPLAVKDCLAAMRFAVQPDDDLTLASLLVSPIGGWSQDQLYSVAHVPRKGSLWRQLRETASATDMLRALLAMADYVSPYVFLETMLSGAIGARKALLARLGNEAADAIDELINAALDYEREGVATLQGFLDWFDRGEGEIVRDAGGGSDAVRVMTVHAAKGLQAPLVILADATADPDSTHDRDLDWVLDGAPVPLFRPRRAEQALVATLEAAALRQAERERREHWRLLYVAMTRAEEQLVVAGALTERQRTTPEDSWHAAVERAMTRMNAPELADPRWGTVRRHATGGRPIRISQAAAEPAPPLLRPEWIDRAAPAEARPPRPLAPSAIAHDRAADPPPSITQHAAAERGKAMHALFERLVPLAPAQRRDAGLRWLAVGAGVTDADERAALVDTVLDIVDAPDFAPLFAADGLAEVPIAGVVDGVVISGTVDRLVVGDTYVDLIDFKTGRRVPGNLDAVPEAHLRQMAAYAAVLRGVFPDRTIRASLLYTSGPRVFVLDAETLATHNPGLAAAQPILARGG